MAGTNPAFDPDEFRDAIHQVMEMGLPDSTAEQPEFIFPDAQSSTAPTDSEQVPFDPDADVTPTVPKTVRAPCTVLYQDAAGDYTRLGLVAASKVVLEFLDEDYQQIKGFEFVGIAGDRYRYHRTEPPSGLFEVTTYRVHCVAEDET